MTYVTIDFSLNSPGICIFHQDTYTFFSYIKPNMGTKKELLIQEELSQLSDMKYVTQPDFTNNLNYSSAELAKIHRYIVTSNEIIKVIQEVTKGATNYIFAFEGTSFGSKVGTNNIIDMAAGAAILKLKLIETFHHTDIKTVAPSSIKKFINKGNMSKLEIWPFFLEKADKIPLAKFCKDKIGYETKKIPKPFDDLIDAFFLLEYIKSIN